MSRADGWLAPVLERLDALLTGAVGAAGAAGVHPFRGLYVDQAEVEGLLAGTRPPATRLTPPPPAGPIVALERLFGLDAFESDVVLLALAPAVDLAYERLYAYLHDDVTRKRPSVGLALDLLCRSAGERIALRTRFAADAPLVRDRIISLDDEAPFLRAAIELDDQIVRLLLGIDGLDRRLASSSRLLRPERRWEDVPLPAEAVRAVAVLARDASQDGVRLYLEGETGLGQHELAEAVATAMGAPLLVAGPEADPGLAAREALVLGAVVLAEDAPDPAALRVWPGGVVLACGRGPAPSGFLRLTLGTPTAALRADCWRRELTAVGVARSDELVDALATRFRLSPAQIATAAETLRAETAWRRTAGQDAGEAPSPFAAARDQTGSELAELATKIDLVHGWDDLVLPGGAIAQLRELCDRVVHRERVLVEWGFDGRLALGKGVTALFTGASGTGKTMAASVIARSLELDTYRINLAGIVSPYIGVTEQNLDRVFAAAGSTNAILFFDEADALFGKRSEVHDSRDRYSNIEVSYLLQKMEEFDGISLLASNFKRNIDDAFLRRLDFTVHFPFPGADERERIWRTIWPAGVPLADDVDFGSFAERFVLSGGAIKNAALAAAFLAAADGGLVLEEHLLHGVQREFNKLGTSIPHDALAGVEST